MKAQLRKAIPAMLALFSLNAAAVTRYVDLNSPSPTPPYTNWPTAATNIQDAVNAALDGDVVLVTNGVYATGGRALQGTMTNRVTVDKPLTLESVNGPQFTVIVGRKFPGYDYGPGAIRCVYLTNGAGLIGFTLTNGATQRMWDDIWDYMAGGGVRCESSAAMVSNCIIAGNSSFAAGGTAFGTLLNCRFAGNSAYTAGGAYGALLSNCILETNTATMYGGGAQESDLKNCCLTGNSAGYGGAVAGGTLNNCLLMTNRASYGGGTYGMATMLNNCVLASNSVSGAGGGAYDGTLNNCTVVGNQASGNLPWVAGGGAVYGTMNNCILYFNTCTNGANWYGGVLNYCCTYPQPTNGVGNITNPPLFIGQDTSNFHLQPNSPCINAGNNSYATNASDLDGNPRMVGGTVDIGAYEFQSPSSVLSYAWAQQNGLPTDGSADFTDDEGDGANNWHEWRADTNPTNALSALRVVGVTNGACGLGVTWESVSTRSYWLERATNLGNASPFQSIASGVAGAAGTKTYTDTSATNGGPYFYRVGVQ